VWCRGRGGSSSECNGEGSCGAGEEGGAVNGIWGAGSYYQVYTTRSPLRPSSISSLPSLPPPSCSDSCFSFFLASPHGSCTSFCWLLAPSHPTPFHVSLFDACLEQQKNVRQVVCGSVCMRTLCSGSPPFHWEKGCSKESPWWRFLLTTSLSERARLFG
jgi:hypothetical protein